MAPVLITGANKGIGLQLTRLYAEAGNKVIACCRNPNDADDLKALGCDIKIKQVVVGDDSSVAALGSGLSGVPIRSSNRYPGKQCRDCWPGDGQTNVGDDGLRRMA